MLSARDMVNMNQHRQDKKMQPSQVDKLRELTDLLEMTNLESYLETMRKEKISLYMLLNAKENELIDVAEKLKIKPGHKVSFEFPRRFVRWYFQMRLLRGIESAKKDGWTALPPFLPMNKAQRSLSQISKEVKFEEFSVAIKTQRYEVITAFLMKYGNDSKTVRHFFKERFKMQTKQGVRELREEDIDTLEWIRSLYANPKHDTARQPLPFKSIPENFIHHLLMVEGTVRGFNEIWTVEYPAPVIYGFISRRQAQSILKHAEPGVFLFRLSVSEPNKIAYCYKSGRSKEVRQRLIHAFQSVNDFKKFAKKNERNMKYVSDNNSIEIMSLEDLLEVLSDKKHKLKMNETLKSLQCLYSPAEKTKRAEVKCSQAPSSNTGNSELKDGPFHVRVPSGNFSPLADLEVLDDL